MDSINATLRIYKTASFEKSLGLIQNGLPRRDFRPVTGQENYGTTLSNNEANTLNGTSPPKALTVVTNSPVDRNWLAPFDPVALDALMGSGHSRWTG